MPLIVVCGIPGSGKTKRSNEIAEYLTQKYQSKVIVINEQNLKIQKNKAYESANQEKVMRGRIKFEVEKNLVGNNIVIADSLNYIKGYRYQMYCIAREVKTTYCVVFCNTPLEKAKEFNAKNENKFSQELLEDLAKRMEYPHIKNRWDIPLFQRRDDEETPFEEIAQTLLFQTKKSKDPVSTKQDEKLSQDYLYQLDKICQQVCEDVCLGKIKLKNNWTAFQTKKVKIDFTGMVREKPINLKIVRQSFQSYILEADKRK